jgi:hypothetical protein
MEQINATTIIYHYEKFKVIYNRSINKFPHLLPKYKPQPNKLDEYTPKPNNNDDDKPIPKINEDLFK